MTDVKENDPYFRNYPGSGLKRTSVYKFDIEKAFSGFKYWRTNDGRCLPNMDSGFELVDNPFDPGSLILFTTYFDPAVAGKSFGGFGIRMPISPAQAMNDKTFIEFDLYYPNSAIGKYMRFEVWSTSSGGEGLQKGPGHIGNNRTQYYIRTADLKNFGNINPDWIGFYKNEMWFKKSICIVTPVTSRSWDFLNIDLHTETCTKVNGEYLMIGNIRITQTDTDGEPIPNVENEKSFLEVEPIRKKYNLNNGYFMVGTVGTGTASADSIRGYHYEIFTDENNLKPECHVGPPGWLLEEHNHFKFRNNKNNIEWAIPTQSYLEIRDSGDYKMHGHCLAWVNQSSPWMNQIIPENITSMEWNPQGIYYTGGNNAAGPYLKVKKETARRIYYNHILYIMRHFMSTDSRYDSSQERGIIPFHSIDVINEDIHESRHTELIQENQEEWKNVLKNVSWLIAMTDDDIKDIRQHYIYLIFKYAHIAIPNAQMAEKYKAGCNDPNIVPAYMRLDNHDHNGSIDAYIREKPPILVYNDYDFTSFTKTRVAYNMIKELNTLWKTDPLYDGRNLIECIGIQGHDMARPSLGIQTQRAIASFATLIDEGLLDCICYSEFDIRQPDFAPGGGALAPAVLNVKQADTIGYQYAMLFKLFEKYRKYIDHVIFWGEYGSGWMQSYLPFDHEKKASQAYYGIMDPHRFIKGHSYLDDYFAHEYDKLKDD